MFPMNLPNVLTVARIMLVPVVVAALLANSPAGDVLAAGVFAVASLTDFLDGYLARSRGGETAFGKLMDPLADKLLITASLVALVSLHRVAAWVAMVIIARELVVTVLRAGVGHAGVVLGASALGKLKTVVQIATIMAAIAVASGRGGTPGWLTAMTYAMVAVTVLSGLDYCFGIRRHVRTAREAMAGAAADAQARAAAES
jgi:CDP-diacylglycerol--glycerol-3-phosphate 3-phosphatidyltransferase